MNHKLWHHKHNRPLVIKVDFDGTIVKEEFPQIGPVITSTRDGITIRSTDVLDYAKKRGAIIICCTCRHHERLVEAKDWAKRNNVPIDLWNENYQPCIDMFGECRKIFGDVDIDDRNLQPWDWWDVVDWIGANLVWVEA